MNPQSTDKIMIDTNNLVPRVIAQGSVEIPVASANGVPGNPGVPSYYGTQTLTLDTVSADLVPFVIAYLKFEFVSDGNTYFQRFNSWEELSGDITKSAFRNWYTITKNGNVLDINFYIDMLADNSIFTYTAFYCITSACFTESSGL